MPKGRREWGSGDDDLDVIDFLADEGGRQRPSRKAMTTGPRISVP